MRYYVFNGDADGLCALQQLFLHERPEAPALVTGVKRHIDLVKDVPAQAGDEVTVLDVSFEVNRAAVLRLLAAGVRVRYFDHHYAGDVPGHIRLQTFIDTAPTLCTSLLVDRHLDGAYRRWAVVGAFGDNLSGFAVPDADLLREFGILLNYNAYGESVDDLHFAPVDLHKRLRAYADPLAFIREDPAFHQLRKGYVKDMTYGLEIVPEMETTYAALIVLPDTTWARRVSGVLASHLARKHPERAHAVMQPKGDGFQVSVRAPLRNPRGAVALCRQFATGGGRESAAGINYLPAEELDRFAGQLDAILEAVGSHSASYAASSLGAS